MMNVCYIYGYGYATSLYENTNTTFPLFSMAMMVYGRLGQIRALQILDALILP